MTREEASNILDDYDVNFDGHTAEEIAEAFDMAFKALEQEQVGHWEPCKYAGNPDKFKKCSNCNTAIEQYEDVYKPDGTYRGRLYNKIYYCPICGVKIGGKK